MTLGTVPDTTHRVENVPGRTAVSLLLLLNVAA
jgi:hypothetical protein